MKFGILTFFDVINYGAALQAYALQNRISKLGFESEFIRLESIENKPDININLRVLYKILKSNNFSLKTYKLAREGDNKKKELFFEFQERYLVQSRNKYYDIDQLKKNQNIYKGFIAGSDMVWSDIGQNLDIYFMSFAPKYKRLSYAPSLTGRDDEDNIKRKMYKSWLEGINKLSCREQYGVNYISDLTGRVPKLVVDPTLLLNKDDWVRSLELKKYYKKKYILCYMFGGISKTIKHKLNMYVKKYNMDVRFIPMSSNEYIYNSRYDFENYIGPKEFVELFYNADFIFTNSYHGLLFSLIMNKPFYVFQRGNSNEWKKHEERISNILRLLRLENRFIFEKDLGLDLDFDIYYHKINKDITILRNDSFTYLSNTLKSVNEYNIEYKKTKINRVDGLDDYMCTGCSSCIHSCPKNAIQMKASSEGFLYPMIDENRCIKCKICAQKCPSLNFDSFYYPKETYCGYGNNILVKDSASGGAFVTIAKFYIEKFKGTIYGAALFESNTVCKHIGVNTIKNLRLLQNSKYVQSDINQVLPECKKNLEMGNHVLFSGTPCQIASLKNYLNKEYINLLTIDVICHGVPSPTFFKKYVQNEIPKNIKQLKFRHRLQANKRRSAFDINYEIGRKTIVKSGIKDPYYSSFIKGESFRESCYQCKYAREERIADITIGDCDSWERYKGLEKNNILSSILINTQLGQEIWYQCKDDFIFCDLDYKMESIKNPQLRRPFDRPDRRSSLYDDLNMFKWKDFKKKQIRSDNFIVRNIKRLIHIVIK